MSNCEFKFIVHTEYEKDYSVQNHTHPCYELVYYLDGTGESVINSTNYKFGQDTFILVGPKTPHSEASATGSEVIFMGFTTNYEDLREGIYENGSETIKAALKEIEAERIAPAAGRYVPQQTRRGCFRKIFFLSEPENCTVSLCNGAN